MQGSYSKIFFKALTCLTDSGILILEEKGKLVVTRGPLYDYGYRAAVYNLSVGKAVASAKGGLAGCPI